MTFEEMVQKFLCPGCVVGESPNDCRNYKPGNNQCHGHVCGTSFSNGGMLVRFALGLPKGFNRPPMESNKIIVRLWPKKDKNTIDSGTPIWNRYNIPVWALEKDGFLFVRSVSPRIAQITTDVVEGGALDLLVPDATDVGRFYDEID